MGKILAVCRSEKKGTQKVNVNSGRFIADYGLENDAHAGNWHRQVSLLSYEKIAEFRAQGADVEFGAFGENLVVEGFDFRTLPVGSRLQCNDVILEITQIGKECHSHCAIYHAVGHCIMPIEGVFARVITPGEIKVNDEMILLPFKENRPLRAAVITLSDKGKKGEREDLSGPIISQILQENGYEVVEELLLADEQKELEVALRNFADRRQVDLVLTTGGTGFSLRDTTPEATLAVATRNASGISEAIRAYSMTITDRGMLSRGASVIRGNTLIVNLPGSPKAVKEIMDYIISPLTHGVKILNGSAKECGGK